MSIILKRLTQKHLILSFIMIVFLVPSIFVACSDDGDAKEKEQWEKEVDILKASVAPNKPLDNAQAAGYDNEFTGYRTQMGFHYLFGDLLDDKFEVNKPEVMIYAPDDNGILKFVAVEYATPIADLKNPQPAPEGFTGSKDVWVINEEFSVWTLHVWVGKENPSGIFDPHNPTLP
ncbi:MAG: hypothetical protein ABI477_05140 [Chryseolinea sp.]